MPGRTFQLEGHDVASLSTAYVVTDVELTAYAAEATPPGAAVYQNRFECAPALAPIRPKRIRKPTQQAAETAVVVGPPGKEIHADEDGRIQVQFHWDLAGKLDGATSTWLRVASAWAGANYGIQFIPRVGMEVVVTFIGGDIDRPLVTGCVHNRTHPLPFLQPAELTKTGIRTATTPDGEGFNELSFDDAKGAEMLFMHAQRDQTRVVENDDSEQVGRDQKFKIGRDRLGEVVERDHLTVGKERVCQRRWFRSRDGQEARDQAEEHGAPARRRASLGSDRSHLRALRPASLRAVRRGRPERCTSPRRLERADGATIAILEGDMVDREAQDVAILICDVSPATLRFPHRARLADAHRLVGGRGASRLAAWPRRPAELRISSRTPTGAAEAAP